MATNSQQSLAGFSQPQVLALVKFSFATCSPDQRTPINWTHLPDRDNLHAVFDHVRFQRSSGQVEEKLVLKVVRGAEVMEDLDLNSLAREAQAGEEALRAMSDPQAQSPVLVIVRSPCIAIRYPLPTRQSRRFQMRFKTEPDYYKALTVLSEAGFLLKQASATVPESRPQSSMQTRPVSSASMTDDSVKQSESQTSYSLQNILAANGSQKYGYTAGQNLQPQVIFGQKVSEVKPTSSSSSCTVTSTAVPRFSSALLPSPALKHTILSPPSYSPSDEYFQVHPTVGATSPAKQSLEQFLQSESQQRPSTASTDFLGISQAMPPRRELPFAKPLPRPSSNSSNRPSPIKKAHPTTNAVDDSSQNLSAGGNKKVPQRPNTKGGKQSKEAGHVPTVEELLKMPTSPSVAPIERQRSLATYKPQPFEASTNTSEDLKISLKRPREELDRRSESGSKRSMVLYDEVVSFQATGAQPVSSEQSSLARVSLDERSSLNIANSNQSFSSHSHPNSIVPLDPWGGAEMDLEVFVAKSPSDRQAEIEEWMCRQLLDPDFKAICEDVEACWRRVLLGVK